MLDLGCGPGTVARRLARRVGTVIGIDRDLALMRAARRSAPQSCRLLCADLGSPGFKPGRADGVWASFVAAYFPDLASVLPALLCPGGWLALVEVDRLLLGHRPLPRNVQEMLRGFEARVRRRRLYDVDTGAKLARFVAGAGLVLIEETCFDDPELAFQGAASAATPASPAAAMPSSRAFRPPTTPATLPWSW